jgi:hypothetical protein
MRINGNVIVGADSPILNIPGGQEAEAMIFLKAGDNLLIEGDVTASAHGQNAGATGGVTKAYIGIFSGANDSFFGDMTINGDLTAKAISSSAGTSDATIEIDSWGTLTWGFGAADPLAEGDAGQVSVQSKESASDTNAEGDTANIIVTERGNLPQAGGVPDFGTIHMGTLIEGNVLDNDLSPEGETLVATLTEAPKHAATWTFDGSGNYTYTPEPGFVGEDTFTYVASSSSGSSDPTVLTITITNTLPTAVPKADIVPMTLLFQGTILDAVSDPDNDPISAFLVTDAVHGTVTVNPDGTYSYLPDPGFIGADSFTFAATDGQIGVEPAVSTVAITLTNAAPTAVGDQAGTNQGIPIVLNVLGNDIDPDGHQLTITSFTYTGDGSVALNSNNTLTYKSADNFLGRETFTYSATDGQIGGTPVTGTVTVTVSPILMVPPAYFMPTGPDLDKIDIDISGCPALTEWAADEIGVDHRKMQVWIVNGLASARGVPPCNACTNLRKAAAILADHEGVYAAAIAAIIDEFGSSTSPMTEETAAYITNAMANNAETRESYLRAEQYFDALSDYVGVLHNDMGFSVEKSAQIVAKKYIDPLALHGDVGVASYVAARLDSVTMFLGVVRLNQANTK